MTEAKAKPWWKKWTWLAKWAVVFALGCAGIASNILLLKIVGYFIVGPTLVTLALFLYGGLWWKIVKLLGGDPEDIWFPWFVILSFTMLGFIWSTAGHHHHY